MGELASALAHELNQPLTAISNYLLAAQQLVQRGPEHTERASDIIGKSIEQAMRAGQIIRQLRNFVQKREVERAPAEIDKVVDEASALAFIGLKEKGIRVAIERQDDLPEMPIDRIQIQQVLINLIRNAVDAMEGRIRRELTIRISRTDEQVKISIIDTGSGIPPEMVQRLFTPSPEQGNGNGCRALDQPEHCRSPRRKAVVRTEPRRGDNFSSRVAAGRRTCFMRTNPASEWAASAPPCSLRVVR